MHRRLPQSIGALAWTSLPAVLILLLNSCATAPSTTIQNPRGRILVCDARDATPLEWIQVHAWQEHRNRERPRAYVIGQDTDYYWLDEVLHRMGEKTRGTDVPLENIVQGEGIPASATQEIPAPESSVTANKNINEKFLKAFQRRVPFAESRRNMAWPETRYITWIWTENGNAPLQVNALARLLREPPGGLRAGLVVNASQVLERPLLADALARRIMFHQDFSLIGSVENTKQIDGLPFADAGILAALLNPGPEEPLSLVEAASAAVTARLFIGPPIVIRDQTVDDIIALLQTEGLGRKFLWCLADINRQSPDVPARVERRLDNSWRFVTPAELLHAASRPELLHDRQPSTMPDAFNVRLFDSIDPMLPLGVGVRWSGEGRPRWCDLRYWLDNNPPFVVPMRLREDWHIGFIPPIVNDAELRYQFMGADENGKVCMSPIRNVPITRPDHDRDGLSDIGEYLAGTNRRKPDTDNDGIPDGEDPDPLRFVEETFLTLTLTDLRQAVQGNAEIRHGCIVLDATAIILAEVRIHAPGNAEGYQIRLRDCRGNYRVIFSGHGLPEVEVLHGRRRSSANNDSIDGIRQELIPAEYALQENIQIRIEHDPLGIDATGEIGGLDILMPVRPSTKNQ